MDRTRTRREERAGLHHPRESGSSSSGNIAFKRMGATPFRTHKATSSAVGTTDHNCPKLVETRLQIWESVTARARTWHRSGDGKYHLFNVAMREREIHRSSKMSADIVGDAKKGGNISPNSSQRLGIGLAQFVAVAQGGPAAFSIICWDIQSQDPRFGGSFEKAGGWRTGELQENANSKASANNLKYVSGPAITRGSLGSRGR